MKIKVLMVQEPENRDTHINNHFIMNHMKDAPSGFVRIYLYFLMESQLGKGVDIEETANNLALPVTYIKEALYYWQETGVIEIEDRLSPVEKTERAPFDEKINEMFIMIERVTKRPLSSKEALEISSWIKDYNMTPEAIIYGYTHAGKNKSSPGTNYVEAIIREWADYGLFTTKEIEEHLLRDFLRKHRRQASTPAAVENEICHPKICPSCSKPMKVKTGSRGDFWGCSGYPECKHTESI